MKTLLKFITVVLLVALLSGCAAMVVGGAAATGAAVHDRRSVGTVVDDGVLRLRVRDALNAHPDFGASSRVRVMTHDGWVLLAGEAGSSDGVELASQIARQVDGVIKLFNELEPAPRVPITQSNADRWLSTRVNTSLTQLSNLPGFDPTRVKVTSTRGVVYLMGLVSRAEAEATTEHVRMVRGVERVVTIFQYTDERPEPVVSTRN